MGFYENPPRRSRQECHEAVLTRPYLITGGQPKHPTITTLEDSASNDVCICIYVCMYIYICCMFMANKNMLTYFLQQLEATSQNPTWSTILHRRRMKEGYETWNCPPRKTKCLNMFWVLINKYHRNLRVPPTSQPPQIMPLRGDSHTSTSAIRFVLSPAVGRRLSFPTSGNRLNNASNARRVVGADAVPNVLWRKRGERMEPTQSSKTFKTNRCRTFVQY